MKIEKIIEELKNTIYLDFKIRVTILLKYKDILQSEIDQNPSSVEAYCLMAMILCELREDNDKSINILDQCYALNSAIFSDDEYSLWATDKAYFLIEECEKDVLQAAELLKQAVKRNSKYANTYYALAKFYFSNKEYEEASRFFSMAYEKMPKKEYKYCEAISLLANSCKDAGIAILESIYTPQFENEETDAKIALSLGSELALKGDIGAARQIANVLLQNEYEEFDIETGEMADLLYILGEYQACIDLYDRCNFLEDSSWLNKYFYCLKQLQNEDLAKEKLDKITETMEQSILQEENNPNYLEDFDNYKDYQNLLISEKKRLKDITDCYNEVFRDRFKPPVDQYYYIIHLCYYIDCPRHYEILQ